MSFCKFPALAALCVLTLGCGSAQAQTNSGNTGGYYGTPQTATIPLYNMQAQPLPLNQMVAGQNAPSYNYGGSQTQPYNFGTTSSGSGNGFYMPEGTLTPQQEAMLAEQLAQQELLYNQQMQMNTQGQGSLAAQLNALNQSPFFNQNNQQEQQGQRVVKRVVRNALNDPLRPPPRLFNPDQ